MSAWQRLIILLSIMSAAGLLYPQTPEVPTFEVASVKRAPLRSLNDGYMRGGPRTASPGQFTASSITLRSLILRAYKLKDFQLVGPDQLSGERYDILAKVPMGTSVDQFLLMTQRLMSDRFHLAYHWEDQYADGYALGLAKSGLKLAYSQATEPNVQAVPSIGEPKYFLRKGKDGFPEIPPDQTEIISLNGRAKLQGYHITMDKLADMLALELNSPVMNNTHLDGRYDFAITWVRNRQPMSTPEKALDDPGPTVFTAVSTLGLKLARAKVPVHRLVVDHVDRFPTEN